MINLTEASIRSVTTMQSFARGREYYTNGAVRHLTRRGNLLTARVSGSAYEPYEVAVTLSDADAVAAATCTCLYDWGGYCKHIVAVLLAASQSDEIEIKADLATLLATLNEGQLRSVLLALAAGQPDLIDAIEEEVQQVQTRPAPVVGPSAQPTASIPYDLAAIRREMRKDFRGIATSDDRGYGRDYYWDDDAGTIYPDEVLKPHRTLAQRLLDAGDAAASVDVIKTMIDAWIEGVENLDEWIVESNEEVIDETALALALLMAEALLSQDLTPEQRDDWLSALEDWDDTLINIDVLETALTQWWDYAPLRSTMQGDITEQGAWEEAPPDFADELTLARLRILERQNRLQEYIHLAEAEGQLGLYVTMLARTGQVEKALAEAQSYLTRPADYLSLAQVLMAQDQSLAALTAAEHGLAKGELWARRDLASWTAAQAERVGAHALALSAAEIAFLGSRTYALDGYKLAQRLAGEQWPSVRARLLEQMKQSYSEYVIDVYLFEGMLVEAMAVMDRLHDSSYLNRVIEATRAQYPDWGIRKCREQAERIMDAGDAKHYDKAAAWLRIARDIHVQHGRQVQWQTYLTGVLDRHGRKYKLVPMLRALS